MQSVDVKRSFTATPPTKSARFYKSARQRNESPPKEETRYGADDAGCISGTRAADAHHASLGFVVCESPSVSWHCPLLAAFLTQWGGSSGVPYLAPTSAVRISELPGCSWNGHCVARSCVRLGMRGALSRFGGRRWHNKACTLLPGDALHGTYKRWSWRSRVIRV